MLNKSSIDYTHKFAKLSLVANVSNQMKAQPLAGSTSIVSFKRKVGYTNCEKVLGRMEVDGTGVRHKHTKRERHA